MKIIIDHNKCDLCGLCIKYCPAYVFSISSSRIVADNEKCVECYGCIPLCPKKAIVIDD